MNITLDQGTAQIIKRVQSSQVLGENTTAEEILASAMRVFEQIQSNLRAQIDEGIHRGLDDVKAGRTTPLPSSGSLDSFVDSILK